MRPVGANSLTGLFLLTWIMDAPQTHPLERAPRVAPGMEEAMPEEVQDAVVESSPTDAAVSSTEVTEQTQVSEQVTPTPEPVKEFHMPPAERWEELRQKHIAAEERAQRAETMARMALERVQAPISPQADPWDGKVNHPDAQTAMFWQEQKRLFEYEARRVSDQQNQSLLQVVDAGRRELAALKISHFRRENPDIKPDSPEEKAIAGLVSQGYDLDTAKKLATYDRLEQENQALKSKQSSVGSKAAANATGPTTSIPAGAGLPGKPGDWRENVRQAARKGGSLADILNAAGASRAP